MPLYLNENVTEQDYDALYEINHLAFTPGGLDLGLFPGGLDPATRAENVQRMVAMRGFGTPTVRTAKVVDDQTGEICAWASMRIFDGPPFMSKEKSDVRFPHVSDDLRPFLEWFTNLKNDRRREMVELQVPGPYGCMSFYDFSSPRLRRPSYAGLDLSTLATNPARQRQGAASLLLKWVVGNIDAMGGRGALSASPTAVQYGLYEKFGFRAIDNYTYGDAERFPNAKPVTMVMMVRDRTSAPVSEVL